MPHDMNGKLIEVGDRVDIPCVVTNVQPDADYCNVTLETTTVMPPENKFKTVIAAINTKQIIKVDKE